MNDEQPKLLDQIDGPEDLKGLDDGELQAVAQEIRERFAAIADVHTAIIREREEHG